MKPDKHIIYIYISYIYISYIYMIYLVGALEPWNLMTLHILGMSSSQLTNSYCSEGLKPPARYVWVEV